MIRAGPFVNEVRIVDGKPEYGDFSVRMNNYLSKIYKYNTINVMGPTIYFAHNDSWGGTQGMVSGYHQISK